MVGSPRKDKPERYTIRDLRSEFPDDETCLEWLRERRWPDGIFCEKCGRVTKHHRVVGRRSYSCQFCGHHVHPTAGTIFHKSTTPLTMWFHAIFLMSQTRCGISAAQLQREIGVTYKTAWRMFKEIRSLLAEDDGEPLGGSGEPVEADETYVGGKRKRGAPRGRPGPDHPTKTPVFGMVERRGRVIAQVMPEVRTETVFPAITGRVLPPTMIYTDEYQVYNRLGKAGYIHRRVHHAANIYVDGDVHTNTIEGFFGLVKNGIRGVHHSVSRKHLQSYLDTYTFRYNHRRDPVPMFKLVLANLVRSALPAVAGS